MRIQEEIKIVLRKHEEILVAYLFGSVAKGKAGEDSDIDIGLLLAEYFEPKPLYTAKVSREIMEETGCDRKVDVRILNNKSIIFQHQVLKDGKKIFSRDESARIGFETEVYDRYLDYKPFFDRFNEIRRKRILA